MRGALQGKMNRALLYHISGFFIAPPIGALTWVLLNGGVSEIFGGIAAWAVVVSWVISVVIGIPAYLLLKANGCITFRSLTLGGAIISVAPWLLLSFPGSTTRSVVGQTIIIENGSYTTAGLLYQAEFLLGFGFCGAVSGVVFWLIVRQLVTRPSN
ncbi:hypothetical protein [Rheinheimera nanhaiensis]|uniref:hypothetical protein n=1 Tax=Rheinheimera nanhaiensis TaxID=1163621 RepID=UPI00058B6946|nr:hypothetical protein [Rheinheimera nanhaiensis]